MYCQGDYDFETRKARKKIFQKLARLSKQKSREGNKK